MKTPTSDLEVKELFVQEANEARELTRFRRQASRDIASMGEGGLLQLYLLRSDGHWELCDIPEVGGSWLNYYKRTSVEFAPFSLMLTHLAEIFDIISMYRGGVVVFDDGLEIVYPGGNPNISERRELADTDLRWVKESGITSG